MHNLAPSPQLMVTLLVLTLQPTDSAIKCLLNDVWPMEQRTLKNVNNYLNTDIYSYLETSGGQSYNLYLNLVHFLTPVLIRHLWQLKTVVFLHWCLICAVLLMVTLLVLTFQPTDITIVHQLNAWPMEQSTLKNVNNYLNTNIYSYLETFGGQSTNLYLNAVHFLNPNVY